MVHRVKVHPPGLIQMSPPVISDAILTRHLRGQVVALDQSAQMVSLTAARVPTARVIQGDAAVLPFADGEFDRLFTSHFYGHLLPVERQAFVTEARRVTREIVVVDSGRREDTGEEEWQERRLNDGSLHRVYKRFFDAGELAAELGGGAVLHVGRWFVAVASRAA